MNSNALALVWNHPLWLAALALPLALLLLSLRRSRAQAVVLGTHFLWSDDPQARGAARRRWRVPPERVASIGALAALILALAEPAPRRPPSSATWRAILDPDPALLLEHTDERGVSTGRGTRLDVVAARIAAEARRAGVRLEWWRPGPEGLEALGAGPPQSSPASRFARAVDPASYDLEGALWVSCTPPEGFVLAGWVASGGGPVSGLIAADRAGTWRWDGEALQLDPPPAERGRVVVGGGLPRIVDELVTLWCEERGLERASAGEATERAEKARLEILPAPVLDGAPVEVARDGWTARARAGYAAPGESWLAAAFSDPIPGAFSGAHASVVTWLPGVVHVGLGEPFELGAGEPGAFAVSWAELLDGALLPAPGVVALAGRAAAGEERFRSPARARKGQAPGLDWPWDARLALLGAGALLAALAMGEGGEGAGARRRTARVARTRA